MKTEIRKSVAGWQFWATLFILCAVAAYCGLNVIIRNISEINRTAEFYANNSNDITRNTMSAAQSLYNNWIGMEWTSPLSGFYFFVFPFCAAIPYGLSLYQERRTGYIAQMMLRETREKYLRNKYVAVFLSGGLVISIPVIVNIMIVAMYFPAYKPDLFCDGYYAITAFSFGSHLFYSIPWLYIVLRVFTIFWYGGIAATMSMAVTFFSRNRFVILFSPMIFFLVLNYSDRLFPVTSEISPLRFLGSGTLGHVYTGVVMGEAVFLTAITILVVWIRGRKHDVL